MPPKRPIFSHTYIHIYIYIFILYDTHRVPSPPIARHRRKKRNRLAYSAPQSVRRDRQIAPIFSLCWNPVFICTCRQPASSRLYPKVEKNIFVGRWNAQWCLNCLSSALRITTQGVGNGRVERWFCSSLENKLGYDSGPEMPCLFSLFHSVDILNTV